MKRCENCAAPAHEARNGACSYCRAPLVTPVAAPVVPRLDSPEAQYLAARMLALSPVVFTIG